jgi:hypothetical protein
MLRAERIGHLALTPGVTRNFNDDETVPASWIAKTNNRYFVTNIALRR